ncbi:MAG: hypothetical protein WCN88_02245 [Candidatus Falkowbacteria bacterium]
MISKNNLINKHGDKIILSFVFLAYLIITLYSSINHQPWRDEAQSWLISRDLKPIGIIKQMPYEGTPPLWHFILYPFAASGLPYSSEFIINYILAVGAIFLLLFFSPLPKFFKIILPFSYFFLFEYSVVARNYSLIIFSLFLCASLYSQRFKKPILYAFSVALLAWSGIQALAIASILTLFFNVESLQKKLEERRYLIAIIIMIVAILSIVFILLPYPDQIYAALKFNGLNYFAKACTISLLPYFDNSFIPPLFYWVVAPSWIIFIIFILKTKTARLIFLSSFFWIIFIILFKHAGALRHYGLILVVFLFSWWLDIYYLRDKTVKTSLKNFIALSFLFICLSASAGYAFYYNYTNRQTNYSGANEMATYLKNNNLLNEEIASYPAISGSALLPYIPGKKIFQMERAEEGTFLTWDDKAKYTPLLPYWEVKNNLIAFYKKKENNPKSVLILSTWPLGNYDRSLLYITKNTKPSITDEYFYLYRFVLPK